MTDSTTSPAAACADAPDPIDALAVQIALAAGPFINGSHPANVLGALVVLALRTAERYGLEHAALDVFEIATAELREQAGARTNH